MNIAVTGATGFIGSYLCQVLMNHGYNVIPVARRGCKVKDKEISYFIIDEIAPTTDWQLLLEKTDIVIHLGARAHIIKNNANDSFSEFRKINTLGTLNLAKQAARSGVKRFIFLSTIKVNGEISLPGLPFSPDDTFIPYDAYGLSKYDAEQGLQALKTSMEVVIIRPPLVYGPGVKANFASLLALIYKNVPLPFGLINNKRSLIALDNLVSFIALCIHHPKAANEIFLISDGEDVSTTELIIKIAQALGKKPFLIPVPEAMLKFAAKLFGKGELSNRLLGSLQVDSSKASKLLGWKPVITMDEQLKKTADAYLNEKIV